MKNEEKLKFNIFQFLFENKNKYIKEKLKELFKKLETKHYNVKDFNAIKMLEIFENKNKTLLEEVYERNYGGRSCFKLTLLEKEYVIYFFLNKQSLLEDITITYNPILTKEDEMEKKDLLTSYLKKKSFINEIILINSTNSKTCLCLLKNKDNSFKLCMQSKIKPEGKKYWLVGKIKTHEFNLNKVNEIKSILQVFNGENNGYCIPYVYKKEIEVMLKHYLTK